MTPRRLAIALLAAGLAVVPEPAAGAGDQQTMNAPAFGTLAVYVPPGTPEEVVLFVSGDGGWNLGVVSMAERLRDAGALVVGIDIRAFLKRLEASTPCAYPAGDLEELARAVELRYKLPAYRRPVLVGYSSGATLVYAAIAAAPSETFAGAISLGFCPDLEIRTPLCRMRGLTATPRPRGIGYDLAPYRSSTVPWMVLQGDIDQVCAPDVTRAFTSATGAARLFELPKVGHGFGVPAHWEPQFLEAFRAVAAAAAAREPERSSAPGVADLSLVEVPATGPGHDDTMAVMLTGDGGWADLDKGVAEGLAAAGVPVVGWSSLAYYWTPRTPDAAAADLARIIEHYRAAWRRSRVLVIGYSFGADVAPFLVNRLPAADRAAVGRVALLGPSDSAAFAFHLASWLGGGGDRKYPTRPEIGRLDVPVLCVSSADETDPVCRAGAPAGLLVETVGQGHHFSGQFARLAALILQ